MNPMVFAIICALLLCIVQYHESSDCERKGGTYLIHEWKCVKLEEVK